MTHVCASESFFAQDVAQAPLELGGPRLLAAELSIAEVRKALAHLRKGWEEVQLNRESKPLYLSNALALSTHQKIRMEDFALHFVLAHHQKRHSGGAAAETERR